MEFNAHKESISMYETCSPGSCEHAVDCDISLPEYLPDIVRILRCYAVPGIQSYHVSGDRVTAECECVLRVLYVCEQKKIRCYTETLHFSKQIELKNSNDTQNISVGIKTEYLNYRVSGQRRFELHGAVTVFLRNTEKKKYEPICKIEGGNIATRCENIQICDLVSLAEKSFSVSETCETGSTSGTIGSVISSSASAIIDELKVVSDKLFLKGELLIKTVCTEQDTCDIISFDNIININQIIEAPDITDDCETDAVLNISALEVRPRFDSAGDKNLLDISAVLAISAYGYQSKSLTVVKDAYSTKYEISLKHSGIYVNFLEGKISDTFLCRGSVDLSSTGFSKIHNFTCSVTDTVFSVRESEIIVSGEIAADILYEDEKGEPAFAQRKIPYEYKRPASIENCILTCRPSCTVTASSYVLGEANHLDARVELNVHGFIFREEEKSVLTEVTVDTSKVKTLKTASLTVYFADAGETLWDIAEKYNTTVDAIIRENHITDSVVNKKCKLLIPKI